MESNGRPIGMALGVLLACSVAAAVLGAESGKPGDPPPQELYFDVESLNQVFEGDKLMLSPRREPRWNISFVVA